MIQRIQSIYLLASLLVCITMYFLPLGFILTPEKTIRYSVCGFYETTENQLIAVNWLLTILLSINVLIQFITIFLYKSRIKQAMLAQISLVLLLLFVFLVLLYKDLFKLPVEEGEIKFNYNIILIGASWLFTYLALKAIKKDEALVRSADRMR